MATFKAVFKDEKPIDVRFIDDNDFIAEFVDDSGPFKVEFDKVVRVSDYEAYTGSHVIIPDFIGTTIDINDKITDRDITVESIPVHQVENVSGGNTVTIGG